MGLNLTYMGTFMRNYVSTWVPKWSTEGPTGHKKKFIYRFYIVLLSLKYVKKNVVYNLLHICFNPIFFALILFKDHNCYYAVPPI